MGVKRGHDTPASPPNHAWYVKALHQDTQGYYWWDVVWGGVGTAKRELLYFPELF